MGAKFEAIKHATSTGIMWHCENNLEQGSRIQDILKSTSGEKTDFMYSVILNKLVTEMEPRYISEGLTWLMK